jgi:hypothetical protein
MSKETLVFIGGIVLTIVPFLGIPSSWKVVATVFIGVSYIYVGYRLRRARFLSEIDRGNGERGTDSFVESTTPLFDDHTVH